MAKIDKVRVYGLNESIVASGYPMQIEIDDIDKELNEKDWKRATQLASVPSGTAHDNFLKGIIVQFDLTAPEYFWRQFDRYHFRDYVSSQSKMHRITRMNVDEQCNKYVTQQAINNVNKYIDLYNNFDEVSEYNKALFLRDDTQIEFTKENLFQIIVSNIPSGLELTARITTNYLQLKSIYGQRKNHKLEEWREVFCPWILTLPHFVDLVKIK